MKLNDVKIEIMKHCLAYDKPHYDRNYYVLGPRCDHFKDWQQLEIAGYATSRHSQNENMVFGVTNLGRNELTKAIEAAGNDKT